LVPVETRPAVAADIAAIDALLAACGAAYLGNSRGAGEAAERLGRPGTRPAVVIDGTGAVLGFGETWRVGAEARCFARVHPASTGAGVGSALLDHLEAQAADLGADHVNVTQWAPTPRAPRCCRPAATTRCGTSCGWSPTSTASPTCHAPGVDFVRVDPVTDRPALYAAWQAAFDDPAVDEAGWWHERAVDPTVHFDPALWLLARADDGIVGFALARIVDDREHGTVGYIGDLGVRPAWRRRGWRWPY